MGFILQTMSDINRAKRAMLNRRNKYYMFRNTDRLKSLKRVNIIFALINIIAVIALCAILVGLVVFLFGSLFSMGNVPKKLTELLHLCLIAGGASIVVLFLSVVVSFMVELSYMRAEKKEMTAIPQGADKYLAIMQVVSRLRKITIISWVISLVLVVTAVITGLVVKNGMIATLAAIATVIPMTVNSFIQKKEFNKVGAEIAEIKEERKMNKNFMVEN